MALFNENQIQYRLNKARIEITSPRDSICVALPTPYLYSTMRFYAIVMRWRLKGCAYIEKQRHRLSFPGADQ